MDHTFTTKLTRTQIEITKSLYDLQYPGEQFQEIDAQIDWSCRIHTNKGRLEIDEFFVEKVRLEIDFEDQETFKFTRSVTKIISPKNPLSDQPNKTRLNEYEMEMDMKDCPLGHIEPTHIDIDMKEKKILVQYQNRRESIFV